MNIKMEITKNKKHVPFLLLAPNVVQMLSGAVILLLGCSLLYSYRNYQQFHEGLLHSVPMFLTSVGGTITLIGLFGSYAAIHDKPILIVTCLISIFIPYALLLNFVTGAHHSYTGSTKPLDIEQTMRQSMIQYGNNSANTVIWDNMQSQFQCCGLIRASEWVGITQDRQVPQSCCPYMNPTSDIMDKNYCTIAPIFKYNVRAYLLNSVYNHGCLDIFIDTLTDLSLLINGFVIGTLLCQTLAILTTLVFMIKATAIDPVPQKTTSISYLVGPERRSPWTFEQNESSVTSIPYVVIPGKL